MEFKDFIKKLDLGVEELILVFLILLNVFAFFNLLPGELHYIKKIISWVILGFLLYRVSLSNVFFGQRRKLMDLTIIVSYFALILKNLVTYADVAIEEKTVFQSFFVFLVRNKVIFEKYFFYLGGITLILLAIYIAFKVDFKIPSVMSTLHEVGPPEISFGNIMKRTMSSFIVLTAFFLLVFNLIMEWLVLAVHSPLVILAIFLYLFVIIKHKEKFDPEKMLFRLAEVGEGFFAKFIKMFHYRQTFALGIAGILVMHLITDLSVFILPYLFSFKENIYLHLGAGHTPIASLMLADFFAAKSVLGKIAINYNYIMNVIAIILLLLGPVFIWFVVYKRQGFTIKNYAFAIFYAALSCFFMSPAFEISHFSNKGIAGVDIITRSIFTNNNTAIMIISLVVGLFAYYLAKRHKRELFIVASVLIQVFFAVYVFHFFISIAQYYLNSVLALLYLKEFFFFFYFLLFFIISLLFYIGGFIIFIHECWVK